MNERHIDIVPVAHAARLAARRASPDESLWALLDCVMDPEVPALSLWELGVLQDIRREADRIVVVVTPTYSGCPAMEAMEDAVRQRLAEDGPPRRDHRATVEPGMDHRLVVERCAPRVT